MTSAVTTRSKIIAAALLWLAAPAMAQDEGFWDDLATDEAAGEYEEDDYYEDEEYYDQDDAEYYEDDEYFSEDEGGYYEDDEYYGEDDGEYYDDEEYDADTVWDEGQGEYFIEDCTTPKSSRNGVHRSCSKGGSTCAKWDQPSSDRCRNIDIQRYVDVNFELFGKSDCRSSERTAAVSMIVLHNGGSGKLNANVWLCRPSASHYTVNRDGTIYQHIGEERRAWHAEHVNNKSIGIELETDVSFKGERCNMLTSRLVKKIAQRDGRTPEDVVRERCEPTLEQYAALDALIYDIMSRHEITDVVGHCEVDKPGGSAHADPRAFDWTRIGMSNDAKWAFVQGNTTTCDWYHVHKDYQRLGEISW